MTATASTFEVSQHPSVVINRSTEPLRWSSLGSLLLAGAMVGTPIHFNPHQFLVTSTPDVVGGSYEGSVTKPEVTSVDLFRSIERIYSTLVTEETALDADAHRALLEHRWDLYL